MKNEKDIAWQCLPKIMRDRIISIYFCKKDCPDSEFNKGYLKALVGIFDEHNITSHVEPEEMLFVEKSKVVELYNRVSTDDYIVTSSSQKLQLSRGIRFALRTLFKDKCLPDKEEQVKPKFEKGQKVVVKEMDRVLTIDELFYNSHSHYWYAIFVETGGNFTKKLSELKPYTEESNMKEFRKGDKVKIVNVANPEVCGKVRVIKEIPTKDEPQYEVSFDSGWTLLDSNQMEHYTEAVMKNISESLPEAQKIIDDEFWNLMDKEQNQLNLGELLKPFVGETFFHPHYGDVEVIEVSDNYIELSIGESGKTNIPVRGCLYSTGMAFLYPDAESLKKYPFDGIVAWKEWFKVKKKEYVWENSPYEVKIDIKVKSVDFGFGNEYNETYIFPTASSGEEAAKIVRQALEKFHQKITKND